MNDRLREALELLIRPDMPPLSPDQRVVIADHLRRWLALTETGQRVEWCETHEHSAHKTAHNCYQAHYLEDYGRCSMIPAHVIPADYLTEEETK